MVPSRLNKNSRNAIIKIYLCCVTGINRNIVHKNIGREAIPPYDYSMDFARSESWACRDLMSLSTKNRAPR